MAKLTAIFSFMEVDVDQTWLDGTAASISPSKSSWRLLGQEQQEALVEACAPGMALIS